MPGCQGSVRGWEEMCNELESCLLWAGKPLVLEMLWRWSQGLQLRHTPKLPWSRVLSPWLIGIMLYNIINNYTTYNILCNINNTTESCNTEYTSRYWSSAIPEWVSQEGTTVVQPPCSSRVILEHKDLKLNPARRNTTFLCWHHKLAYVF